MCCLLPEFPRERWNSGLPQTAAFWLQMHAGFRASQGRMAALVAGWRAGQTDARGLHGRLIPELQGFLQHLDGHRRIESGHYFPQFRALEPRIGEGLDLLDRDHDAIHAHLEALYRSGLALHQAVSANAPGQAEAAARLGEALDRTAGPLRRHLDDEEDVVIPLMARAGL